MQLAKKITLLFAILSAVIISLLSGFVWYFSNEFAFEDFYKRLEARVNLAAEIRLSDDKSDNVYAKVRNQYLERLPDEKEYVIAKKDNKKPVLDVHLPDDFFVDLEMEPMETPEPLAVDLDDAEDLNRQLQAVGGNISHLARRLGVSRNTLYKRLRQTE